MPPHADQLLQERILKTAQKLWRTRGESGLTLRAVARDSRQSHSRMFPAVTLSSRTSTRTSTSC